MIESLKHFFETLPMNHWLPTLIMILAVLGIIYVCFFFFSKEGRDERGKKIFAHASFISFSVTLLWLVLLSGPLFPVKTSSINASAFSTIISIDVLVLSQSLAIMVMKKLT